MSAIAFRAGRIEKHKVADGQGTGVGDDYRCGRYDQPAPKGWPVL